MAAQTSIKVAVQTGAAKDDVFDQGQITEDSSCIALNVLANDPGSAKLWSVEQGPLSVNDQVMYYKLDSGAIVSIVDGILYYDPSSSAKFQNLGAGETCEETFTYTVRMANGALSLATVKIVIGGENDAPEGSATAILATGTEDTDYTIAAADLLKGFTDVDGDTLSVANLIASNGELVDNGHGSWTFKPAPNYNGSVNLSYTVVDGNGGSVAASQNFSLAPVNDAPEGSATAILATGTEDTDYTIAAADLLKGFTDVDGDTLSVANLIASNGELVDNGHGSWTFKPAPNYNGSVNLSYTVVDGNGGSVAASQNFSLAPVNDPAAIGDPNKVSVIEDVGVVAGKLSVSGSIAILDVDGAEEAAFREIVTAAQGTLGTLVLQTDGTYTYSVENSAFQYLNSYQFEIEKFTVTSIDGTNKNIFFKIYGADETTKVAPPAVTSSNDPKDTVPLGVKTVTEGTNQSDILKGTPDNDLMLDGLQGSDTIYGLAGNDYIRGSQGNDTIYGGSGTDEIHGDEGSDIIIGGLGADTLNGNNGADTFVFLDFRDTGDIINDFSVGQDKIAFKASLDLSFSDLIFTQLNGNTIVSVDKLGGSTTAYEMQFSLLGLKTLSTADFDFNWS